ncbi:hypothetical protein SCALM49S_01802 [Streptomyces californicus]
MIGCRLSSRAARVREAKSGSAVAVSQASWLSQWETLTSWKRESVERARCDRGVDEAGLVAHEAGALLPLLDERVEFVGGDLEDVDEGDGGLRRVGR